MRKTLLFLTLVLLIQLVLPVFTAGAATQYSSPLEDLNASGNFDASLYPEVSTNYSLQVIAMAEGTQGELFVYVYQPCGVTRLLQATKISIASPDQGSGERSFRLYNLSMVGAQGVFHKYKVEGFVLRTDPVRKYSIPEIFRKYDSELDGEYVEGTTGEHKAFPVGMLFTFTGTGGNTISTVASERVIKVENQFVGDCKYENTSLLQNFLGHSEDYQSHFIAFKTDLPMDEILEVDVYFTTQSVRVQPDADWGGIATEEIRGAEKENYVTLTKQQILEINTSGFFGNKYTFKRIQKMKDFLECEEDQVIDDSREAMEGMEWVLRFYETVWTDTLTTNGGGADLTIPTYTGSRSWTEVKNVALLRLEFMYDGVHYNLGVVGDIVSGDGITDSFHPKVDAQDLSDLLYLIIGLIVGLALLFVFWPLIIGAVKGLCKLLYSCIVFLLEFVLWLLTLPFRLLFR